MSENRQYMSVEGIFLLNEIFSTNTDALSKIDSKQDISDVIHNKITIGTAIGVNDKDATTLGFKLQFTLVQTWDEQNSMGEKIEISKLETEFVVQIRLKNKNSDYYVNLLENQSSENEEEISELSQFLVSSTYPYIKDHVENIYKKADLPIEIPFSI